MLANHEGKTRHIDNSGKQSDSHSILRVLNKYRQIETQKTVSGYRQM